MQMDQRDSSREIEVINDNVIKDDIWVCSIAWLKKFMSEKQKAQKFYSEMTVVMKNYE